MPKLSRLLDDPTANGVYRLATDLAEIPQARRIDARDCADKAKLLAAIGEVFAFPDYYGLNWDALEECLFDLSWWSGPVVLLIEHADALPEDGLATLVDIWTEAAKAWSKAGRVFVLLLAGAITLHGLPAAEV